MALYKARQVDSSFPPSLYFPVFFHQPGQVAQLVERGPEKAGVGGSIPSLATINSITYRSQEKRVRIFRANNTRTANFLHFTFGVAR